MIKCSTNIRTEIFFANEINKAGFYHNFHRLLIYMGEDEGNSFGFADLCEILQCIQCGTVKGRHASHTKNEAGCKVFHYDMFNGICGTEEQRTGNLLDTDLKGKTAEVFIHIRSIIIHISPTVYMSFFTHPFNEKQAGKHHADLDRNNEIKYDREDKCCK